MNITTSCSGTFLPETSKTTGDFGHFGPLTAVRNSKLKFEKSILSHISGPICHLIRRISNKREKIEKEKEEERKEFLMMLKKTFASGELKDRMAGLPEGSLDVGLKIIRQTRRNIGFS
ncbi:hypothetical protein SK355_12320 [Candidatus Fukatsuia symbiotica]|uniref:Uncharacterized protein n=1 Tax=Candidatus Fukatsuia symbiotica TaxID=1878942 RepID=A0A2U8I3R1_9GAMM|nr:hypothetical protein [Candidatus Fukatsuia symbiotica]AWK13770.1 hypothetical protein CCS41_03615 [Candidatus Fukatsuia symbiotica]MEA9445954.1 hypothetical protein [Candidatus Fukatsuia symbiotica]